MSKHLCRDCGATEADGATFETRPGGRVKRLVCSDCIAAARAPTPKPTTLPVTRASYRAAHRRRAALAQFDLVDLLVPPPHDRPAPLPGKTSQAG